MSWKMNPDGTAERPADEGGTRKLLIKPKFAAVVRDEVFCSVSESIWQICDTEDEARQFIKEFVEVRNKYAD